jgi:hypothetical protein
MKQFLFAIISTFVSFFCYSQTNSPVCSLFKTGNFAYRDSATNSIWEITRTKKKQLEKNNLTGTIIKNKIRWLSDCEYQLTQIWTNKKEWRKGNFKSRIYKIIPTAENIYNFSCDCSNNTKIQGTVVKVML